MIKELTAAVWDDKKILREVVDNHIAEAVKAVCYSGASSARRHSKAAAQTGVKAYKPRFGDNREAILENTEKARQAWLNGLGFHRLFGGKYLREATVADVEASIAAHEQHLDRYTAGVKDTIRLETAILTLAKKAKTDKIADVLVVGNEDTLKGLVTAEAA